MAKINDIDWAKYFESIQKVCPWSLESFEKGRIDFVPYTWEGLNARDVSWPRLTQREFDAVVYLMAPDDPMELDLICEQMESSPYCVYFWSHPDYTKGGFNQTPIPIIIQQDRMNLLKVRKANKKHK
jgi:hypothetical protein